MITDGFVIIPVQYQSIVPVGIGSVNIDTRGRMTFVIGVESFGKTVQEEFRKGNIKAIQIVAVGENESV
jgi:hypothetical protein